MEDGIQKVSMRIENLFLSFFKEKNKKKRQINFLNKIIYLLTYFKFFAIS